MIEILIKFFLFIYRQNLQSQTDSDNQMKFYELYMTLISCNVNNQFLVKPIKQQLITHEIRFYGSVFQCKYTCDYVVQVGVNNC